MSAQGNIKVRISAEGLSILDAISNKLRSLATAVPKIGPRIAARIPPRLGEEYVAPFHRLFKAFQSPAIEKMIAPEKALELALKGLRGGYSSWREIVKMYRSELEKMFPDPETFSNVWRVVETNLRTIPRGMKRLIVQKKGIESLT